MSSTRDSTSLAWPRVGSPIVQIVNNLDPFSLDDLSRLPTMLIQSSRRPTPLLSHKAVAPSAAEPAKSGQPEDTVDAAHEAQAQRISSFITEKKLDGARALKQAFYAAVFEIFCDAICWLLTHLKYKDESSYVCRICNA